MLERKRPSEPLSPPSSPRMSDAVTKATDYNTWQYPPPASSVHLPSAVRAPPPPLPPPPASGAAPVQDTRRGPADWSRPALRSHKSFPYSFGPSNPRGAPTSAESREPRILPDARPISTSNVPPSTFGGSAPTSPAARLTPPSPGAAPSGDPAADDDVEFGTAGHGADDDDDDDHAQMTAAERRAEKRRMKRFRLTHNQTRFLMSEFARQPHPDAAHREWLSREIPGLSPRQVQVWFQNRRAKLKRLTMDDRERIMRSRALPADFKMTPTLHAPFAAPPTQPVGAPVAPSAMYVPYTDASGMRLWPLDTARRPSDYEAYGAAPPPPQSYVSPTGISPALNAFAFTPPQSATDATSPGPAPSRAPTFGYAAQESPRRNPFIPVGIPHGFGPQHGQMLPPQYHDRPNRHVGESPGSSLRTSISYSDLGSGGDIEHQQQQQQERAASFSGQSLAVQDREPQPRRLTVPHGTDAGLYGLGFSFTPAPGYHASEPPPPSAVSLATPPSMEMPADRRGSGHYASAPMTSIASYQPLPYAAQVMPPYQTFGTYPSQPFENPFPQQQPPRQPDQPPPPPTHTEPPEQSYAPLSTHQPPHYMPLEGVAPHEAGGPGGSSGNAPAPPSYEQS